MASSPGLFLRKNVRQNVVMHSFRIQNRAQLHLKPQYRTFYNSTFNVNAPHKIEHKKPEDGKIINLNYQSMISRRFISSSKILSENKKTENYSVDSNSKIKDQDSQDKVENEEESTELVKKKEGSYSKFIKILRPTPTVKYYLDIIKHEIEHYKTGFVLLWYDIKTSSRLTWRSMTGEVLTRRERRQLVRTVSDLLRIIPFSIFLIVPFMELLLPVALKLFPGMLPSTFDSKDKREERRRKQLKIKLDMAKVIQDSMEEMSAIDKKHIPESDTELHETLAKIRTKSEDLSQEEVLKLMTSFENEFTLDNLSRQQVVALCKMINVPTIGTVSFLTFQLRIRMRQLRADDMIINIEGIESMTVAELQTACQDRGMRAIGISLERLRAQMEQWLNLTLKEKVPMSMMLLSRALLTTATPDVEIMKNQVLSNFSDKLVSEAEIIVKNRKGEFIANKERLEQIKEENKRIAEERAEEEASEEAKRIATEKEAAATAAAAREQEVEIEKPFTAESKAIETDVADVDVEIKTDEILKEKLETLVEDVKTINVDAKAEEKLDESLDKITQEELQDIADAVTELSSASRFENERQELQELREEREEYKLSKSGEKQSFVTKALENKVDKIIKKIDSEITKREKKLSKSADVAASIDTDQDGVITLEELINGAKQRKIPLDESKLLHVAKCLDLDNDGKLTIAEIQDVLDALEKEGSDITTADIERVSNLLASERLVGDESLTK